ncbi:MAG TPA: hypothetical protein VG722_06525 [Tepidisphaeraceae bacterium]|nr:hypothetical protein [Tepidisphaeraceae bacterium]
MRMAVGLVGVLAVLLALVWFLHSAYLPYVKTVSTAQKQATPEVREFAGRDTETGAAINTTYKLVPQESGGKVLSLLVTRLDPNSAMVTMYGLKRDDSIVAISWHGDMERVKDIDDPEMAEDRVIEAYRGAEPIIVVRDGQEMTLKAKTPPPAITLQAPQQGSTNNSSQNSLQQQLNAIQQVPTH